MFALPNPLTALHNLLDTPTAIGDPDFDPLPAPVFQRGDIVVDTQTSATLEIFAVVDASPYWGGAEEPHAFVQGYLYVADALAAITDSSAAAAFERALDRLDIDNARAGETPLWEGDL